MLLNNNTLLNNILKYNDQQNLCELPTNFKTRFDWAGSTWIISPYNKIE